MGKEQYQQNSFLADSQPTKSVSDIDVTHKRRRQLPPEKKLREAIAPYMDVPKLRQLASDPARLEDALRTGDIPEEISWLLSLLATVLKPRDRDQVRSPSDIASFLQVSMGHECQEQLCVAC